MGVLLWPSDVFAGDCPECVREVFEEHPEKTKYSLARLDTKPSLTNSNTHFLNPELITLVSISLHLGLVCIPFPNNKTLRS
jgi:hypothetical protein